jgi:hypothetical protein
VNGIDPTPLRKRIADILDTIAREDPDTEQLMGAGRQRSRGKAPVPGLSSRVRVTWGCTPWSWPACRPRISPT